MDSGQRTDPVMKNPERLIDLQWKMYLGDVCCRHHPLRIHLDCHHGKGAVVLVCCDEILPVCYSMLQWIDYSYDW